MSVVTGDVRQALASRGAILNPPANAESIQATERRLGVCLPGDLRSIYLAFDGTSKETEGWFWNFWPLEKLETRAIGSKRAGESLAAWNTYLAFCDANFWLPVFGVCVDPGCAGNTEVRGSLGGQWFHCAPSLDAFLRMLPQQMDDLFIDSME